MPEGENLSERETAILIRDILEGNVTLFRTLVETYKSDVFGLAIYTLGNFHDAEDIAQEVFLAVFKNLKKYNSAFKFKNWLLKITHNKCINFMKTKKMNTYTLDKDLKDKLAARQQSVLPDDQKVLDLVREGIAQLDPESRSIFTLFHVEGLEYRSISEITRKSVGNLKVIVHRARKSIYNHGRSKIGKLEV